MAGHAGAARWSGWGGEVTARPLGALLVAAAFGAAGLYVITRAKEPFAGILLCIVGGCWLARELPLAESPPPTGVEARPSRWPWLPMGLLMAAVVGAGCASVLTRSPMYAWGYLG